MPYYILSEVRDIFAVFFYFYWFLWFMCNGLDLHLSNQDMYKLRLGTWNLETLIDRSRELAEVLMRRNVNRYLLCCIQEKKSEKEIKQRKLMNNNNILRKDE